MLGLSDEQKQSQLLQKLQMLIDKMEDMENQEQPNADKFSAESNSAESALGLGNDPPPGEEMLLDKDDEKSDKEQMLDSENGERHAIAQEVKPFEEPESDYNEADDKSSESLSQDEVNELLRGDKGKPKKPIKMMSVSVRNGSPAMPKGKSNSRGRGRKK